MKPTDELYQSLQVAYGYFNQTLFRKKLPNIIFTVQRQNGVLGYFAADRWSSLSGARCHEIAINPAHMGDSRLIEVLQTLVHEMVHCWQHCYGSPSRGCYHNKEWAYKMVEIGLQPSSTGLPGGAIIGQQMSDYPIEKGLFIKMCYALVNEKAFNIPWIDRRSTPKSEVLENAASQFSNFEEPYNEVQFADQQAAELMTMNFSEIMPENTFMPYTPQTARVKQTYQCPDCFNKVWGKPDLDIICGDCDVRFEEL